MYFVFHGPKQRQAGLIVIHRHLGFPHPLLFLFSVSALLCQKALLKLRYTPIQKPFRIRADQGKVFLDVIIDLLPVFICLDPVDIRGISLVLPVTCQGRQGSVLRGELPWGLSLYLIDIPDLQGVAHHSIYKKAVLQPLLLAQGPDVGNLPKTSRSCLLFPAVLLSFCRNIIVAGLYGFIKCYVKVPLQRLCVEPALREILLHGGVQKIVQVSQHLLYPDHLRAFRLKERIPLLVIYEP